MKNANKKPATKTETAARAHGYTGAWNCKHCLATNVTARCGCKASRIEAGETVTEPAGAEMWF
jgi:hypothetical protein